MYLDVTDRYYYPEIKNFVEALVTISWHKARKDTVAQVNWLQKDLENLDWLWDGKYDIFFFLNSNHTAEFMGAKIAPPTSKIRAYLNCFEKVLRCLAIFEDAETQDQLKAKKQQLFDMLAALGVSQDGGNQKSMWHIFQ